MQLLSMLPLVQKMWLPICASAAKSALLPVRLVRSITTLIQAKWSSAISAEVTRSVWMHVRLTQSPT